MAKNKKTNHNGDNITRSKDRIKQTGEIFTPLALVDEILQKLSPEVFEDPTKTFIDPAAGNGNFIIRVIQFKEAYGSTIWEAISTTYATELMEDNVAHMHKRIYEWVVDMDNDIDDINAAEQRYGALVRHNYFCADSLKFDYDSYQPYK